MATVWVDVREAGTRVEDHLVRAVPGLDRRALRAAIGRGDVRRNGEETHPQQKLRVGDQLEIDGLDRLRRRRQRDPDDLPLPILYEDERVLVVDKPSGLASVPDRAGKYRGVHGRLAALRPDADLRIVHRLDRGTSGCMALAKGLEAARALS